MIDIPLKKENKELMKINFFEEPTKIKSPKKDENVTDWYDKNEFKK